jgi:hypothetical protein
MAQVLIELRMILKIVMVVKQSRRPREAPAATEGLTRLLAGNEACKRRADAVAPKLQVFQ